ncbi:chemotaxis protein CheW [Erythrobacter sp. NAP1]|uniref:chemotaxis protein CheW n=1 Tax=Erythrobacter sp. NAP1 TaxID=237727 RepID=UPI0000687927|nr:chemotaxis protein CheW [Erythrobacter sp. NAP1]EAQ29093.1 chemotaxis protein CheW [Erythrobacter sp. NAP1]
MNELLVMCQIAGRRCAFRANDVQSVIEIGAITPVPRTPDHIAGLTALRSQALTVIDCRRAIGFDPQAYSLDHRAIVVASSGYSYALRIDSIEDITSAIGEPGTVPGGFGAEWSNAASGLVETRTGPALMMDLSALIAGQVSIENAA